MLRRDHDVFHAGVLRQLHPVVGLELHGVELHYERLVLAHGNLRSVHDPFAEAERSLSLPFARRDRIEAPMDEEAVLRLPEPFESLLARGVRGTRRGCLRMQRECQEREKRNDDRA